MFVKRMAVCLAAVSLSVPAMARGGHDGGEGRLQKIDCALYFNGSANAEAPGSATVENASAVVRGVAQEVEYLFSVRGKTAVAKLTSSSTGQIVTAQGAIEMLRHGGRPNSAVISLRRGDDDANDGNPEKEAGFELNLANQNGLNVKLKCLSTNM